MLEINKIYCGDNCTLIKELDGNSIDLVITSPPYDGIRKYNGYSFDFKFLASDLFRVIKDGGVIVWIVGDETIKGSETGSSFEQVLFFKSLGFNLHDTMIFQKDNPVPVGGNNRYYQHFEYMFILSKGVPKTFNPILQERRNKWNDKRTQRFKGFTRNTEGVFTKKLVSLNQIVKRGNIWKYVVGGGNNTSDKIAYKHPAIFPDELAKDHILSWSNEGDLILDPFLGSGTTAKISKQLKRNYIGFEISSDYVKIAEERISLI